jgi:exosome complex RNA-binding protein Rrp4
MKYFLKLRRQKHHFVKLDCGVFLILAHNGNIWISERENNQTREFENQKNKEITTSNETKEKMAKVFKIRILSLKLF